MIVFRMRRSAAAVSTPGRRLSADHRRIGTRQSSSAATHRAGGPRREGAEAAVADGRCCRRRRVGVWRRFWPALWQVIVIEHRAVGRQRPRHRAWRAAICPTRTRGVSSSSASLGAIVLRIGLLRRDQPAAQRALSQAGRRRAAAVDRRQADRPRKRASAERSRRTSTLWAAISTIVVADAVMSLDNVIAIAGAAGNFVLCDRPGDCRSCMIIGRRPA